MEIIAFLELSGLLQLAFWHGWPIIQAWKRLLCFFISVLTLIRFIICVLKKFVFCYSWWSYLIYLILNISLELIFWIICSVPCIIILIAILLLIWITIIRILSLFIITLIYIIVLISFLQFYSKILLFIIVSFDVIIWISLKALKLNLILIFIRRRINIGHFISSLRLPSISIFSHFNCILNLLITWRWFRSILYVLTTRNVPLCCLKTEFTHAVGTLFHVWVVQLAWNLIC